MKQITFSDKQFYDLLQFTSVFVEMLYVAKILGYQS